MKLREIADKHNKLALMVDSEELSIDEVKDTFDLIEGEFNDKAVSLVAVTLNMGDDVKIIKDEIKRLQARVKSIEVKQDSMKDYLKFNMQKSGISNIKCPMFSITLAKGREVVEINDPDLVPNDYVNVSVVENIDKRKVLADLKDGKDIPGCSLVRTDESIRIK
ncbi:MAG: siphovirus Gp157 family protein [Oleispira sp.]|nr:siphovirus Gp157 family protein [Oleispira sp.]